MKHKTSLKIYKYLINFYPADFKRGYGALILDAFEMDAKHVKGKFALINFWRHQLIDLAKSILKERQYLSISTAAQPTTAAFGQIHKLLVYTGLLITAANISSFTLLSHFYLSADRMQYNGRLDLTFRTGMWLLIFLWLWRNLRRNKWFSFSSVYSFIITFATFQTFFTSFIFLMPFGWLMTTFLFPSYYPSTSQTIMFEGLNYLAQLIGFIISAEILLVMWVILIKVGRAIRPQRMRHA